MEDCLAFWGLDGKLSTVTIYNASSNNTAISYVKGMAQKKGCISDENLFT